jgi:tetratricopeptide (TPR) repeat protein
MSGPPPQSLLITPDLRRRLQQRYEEAQRLAACPRPDIRRIHELFADCVRADPGNILYLDALLANLRRRKAAGGESWWQKWWDSGKTTGRGNSVSAATTEYSELQAAPDMLWQLPNDISQLKRIAAAAGKLDFDEVELRYLQLARDVEPDDVVTLQMLARALTRQGRFEDALGPWCAVLALKPGDSEAEQAINDLRDINGANEAVGPSELEGLSDSTALVRHAQSLRDAGDFAAAERYLAQAQAASGANLSVLVLREDLRIRHSEQRLEVAKRRAASDADAKAQRLVERMMDEHKRLEIEIFNARAERLPAEATVRIELARRLKDAVNFSGAIQRLEEALRLRPDDAAAFLELGECWQHLRQFTKALDFYQRAAATGESSPDELRKLAHYRGGVLAAALERVEVARDHFHAVLAMDAAYKDTRERLDKLGLN